MCEDNRDIQINELKTRIEELNCHLNNYKEMTKYLTEKFPFLKMWIVYYMANQASELFKRLAKS